ncbi:MAG TPA: hypothetical protein DCO82_12435 [Alphaproteobacteria bacterium]|nr:hypothetical protein [Alphaproteobacteria bacterium]
MIPVMMAPMVVMTPVMALPFAMVGTMMTPMPAAMTPPVIIPAARENRGSRKGQHERSYRRNRE